MNVRDILALTILLLLYLLCNRLLRARISAEARFIAGLLLLAVFCIPFRFTLLSFETPIHMEETFANGEIIIIDETESAWDTIVHHIEAFVSSETVSKNGDFLKIFLLIIYSVGVIASLGFAIYKHIRLCKTLKRCAKMPSAEMQWQFDMLCGKMRIRHKPRLVVCCQRVSSTLGAPFTFGLFRRVVVMPMDVCGEEAEMLLEHELFHCKRHDTIVRLLLTLLRALYWYHPLIPFFTDTLSAVCEEACDESMMDGKNSAFRGEYGKLLVQYASDTPMLSVSFSSTGKRLKKRIEALFSLGIRREGYVMILAMAYTIVMLLGTHIYTWREHNYLQTGEEYLQALETTPAARLDADVLYAFDAAERLDDLALGVYYTDTTFYVTKREESLFYRDCLVSFVIVQSADGSRSEVHRVYTDTDDAKTCVGIRIIYDSERNESETDYKRIEILSEKELLDCYAYAVLETENQAFSNIPNYHLTDEWEKDLLLAAEEYDPDTVSFYQTLIERVHS